MNRVRSSWLLGSITIITIIAIVAINCSKSKPAQTTASQAAQEESAPSTADMPAPEPALPDPEPAPTEPIADEPEPMAPTDPLPPLPAPQPKLAKFFVGTKGFGVNRVNEGKRSGAATIVKDEQGTLVLTAELTSGDFDLKLSGNVHPIGRREFILDGEMTGTPNLSFRSEAPMQRTTSGRFLFKATGSRRFWRMYEVNGADCVCNDSCGNDFCYVDISFGKPAKR